jgi:FK506-binding protein 4/5
MQLEAEKLKIDSSRDRKTPLEFRVGLGQVIPGLDMSIKRLSRGQRAKITIPPGLAYGSRGYPPIIPPGATLVYDVELISFA